MQGECLCGNVKFEIDGRYGISISVTARCAEKPQGLPLTQPRLCRVLVFVGSQVKARSGRTKSQVVSGAIFVHLHTASAALWEQESAECVRLESGPESLASLNKLL